MIVFLKRLGLFFLVLFGLATIMSECSLYFLRQSSFYKPSFVKNSLKYNSYDYVIIGSSIGLTTLNTRAIDSISGYNGVNLSMDDTGIGAQYLMLKHFLSEGNKTKYCVLATSAASLNNLNPKISTNDYRFLPFVRKNYVNAYFESLRGREANVLKFSKYFSLIGTSYYNVELFYPSLFSVFNRNKFNRFDENGNYHYPMNMDIPHQLLKFSEKPISLQNPYLELLQTVCDEYDIKLVIYIAPMKGITAEISEEYSMSIINHSDILKDHYYFNDLIHVNFEGRKEASIQFTDSFDELSKIVNE